MLSVESFIINVSELVCCLLIIGVGDDPDDVEVDVPQLPPNLAEFARRPSKVDIDVVTMLYI